MEAIFILELLKFRHTKKLKYFYYYLLNILILITPTENKNETKIYLKNGTSTQTLKRRGNYYLSYPR